MPDLTIQDHTAAINTLAQASADALADANEAAKSASAALEQAAGELKTTQNALVQTKSDLVSANDTISTQKTTIATLTSERDAARKDAAALRAKYEPPIVVGPTYNVQPGDKTLQAAIDKAASGAKLFPSPGIYTGQINIPANKVLTIDGGGKAVLDGQGKLYRAIIDLAASQVSGLVVQNYLAGTGDKWYEAAVVPGPGSTYAGVVVQQIIGTGVGFKNKKTTWKNCIIQNIYASGFGGSSCDGLQWIGGASVNTNRGHASLKRAAGTGIIEIGGLGYEDPANKVNKITRADGVLIDGVMFDGVNGVLGWFDLDNKNVIVRKSTFRNARQIPGYRNQYDGKGLFYECGRGPYQTIDCLFELCTGGGFVAAEIWDLIATGNKFNNDEFTLRNMKTRAELASVGIPNMQLARIKFNGNTGTGTSRITRSYDVGTDATLQVDVSGNTGFGN